MRIYKYLHSKLGKDVSNIIFGFMYKRNILEKKMMLTEFKMVCQAIREKNYSYVNFGVPCYSYFDHQKNIFNYILKHDFFSYLNYPKLFIKECKDKVKRVNKLKEIFKINGGSLYPADAHYLIECENILKAHRGGFIKFHQYGVFDYVLFKTTTQRLYEFYILDKRI